MKKLLFILLLFTSCQRETLYCGKVIDKYIIPPGYKVAAQMHVVFYCDSLHRNVDVVTTRVVRKEAT